MSSVAILPSFADAVTLSRSACDTPGLPVYHVQRKAPLNGSLLLRHGCAVVEEVVHLEEGTKTVYTPVYCLGTAESFFLRNSPLCSQRALYTVQEGTCLLVYTPYRQQSIGFGKRILLPVFSVDREAMFQFAFRQTQLTALLGQRSDDENTIKMCRVSVPRSL